jgi:hypothetical protein
VTVDPQLEEALGALGIADAVPALRHADETSTD